ncbi:MAG: flagellin lysine-N-methylase [Oscillospiraceae bacterium]
MYFRQPSYFGDFSCVGGDCQFTCCAGWRIDIKGEEIEKILSAPNISDELRELVEKTFVKLPDSIGDGYIVRFSKENNHCPLQTNEGWCRIQRELGEDYLPQICCSYPRVYRVALDINTESYPYAYRFCNLSCLEVARRLVTDKKAMNLINVPMKKGTAVNKFIADRDEACESNPELLFRTDLFEFFYGLISDKKFSVETAIIHGAIAAGILNDIVNEKQYASIPQALGEMREGFLKGNLFRELDEIQPDYTVKVGFIGKIIRDTIASSPIFLLETPDGKLDLARYLDGEKKLAQMFDGDDFWLRNIALNLLFELSVPLYSTKYTILENYSLFMMAFACIKFNAITSVSSDTPGVELVLSSNYSARFKGMDRVWGFASIISRTLCQNSNNAEKLIKAVKDAKLTTPIQLALLIK